MIPEHSPQTRFGLFALSQTIPGSRIGFSLACAFLLFRSDSFFSRLPHLPACASCPDVGKRDLDRSRHAARRALYVKAQEQTQVGVTYPLEEFKEALKKLT